MQRLFMSQCHGLNIEADFFNDAHRIRGFSQRFSPVTILIAG
jgi:hypothetical protein